MVGIRREGEVCLLGGGWKVGITALIEQGPEVKDVGKVIGESTEVEGWKSGAEGRKVPFSAEELPLEPFAGAEEPPGDGSLRQKDIKA